MGKSIEVGVMKWDLAQLSRALKLSEEDTRLLFQDGRRVGFMVAHRLVTEVMEGTVTKSGTAPYDIEDSRGRKWEVRLLSKRGIAFSPAYMRGVGRKFTISGFLERLGEIAGFVVFDVSEFPTVRYWFVESETVLAWWCNSKLGKGARLSRKGALRLMPRYKQLCFVI